MSYNSTYYHVIVSTFPYCNKIDQHFCGKRGHLHGGTNTQYC